MLSGLISAAHDRKIRLRIVNNIEKVPSSDTVELVNAGIILKVLELFYCVLYCMRWIRMPQIAVKRSV